MIGACMEDRGVKKGDNREDLDYSPHEEDTFNAWVELGALDPKQQRVLDHSPMHRFTKKMKSSSEEAEEFIHEPLKVLLADGIPGVREDSRVTSTIVHHERGLKKHIIRATVNVERSTGDVAIEYDKETW